MIANIGLRRICLSNRLLGVRLSTSSATTTQSNDYFDKNKLMNRPLSPYVIYKFQLTSVLSITHRMTGLGLSVLLYGGGISALASQQTNFAQVLQSVQTAVPHSLLLTLKVLAGTSIVYHTLNGLRHLSWDFGFGYGLKQLYASGYAVIALTLLSAIALIVANN